jgi:hypothetical protein
MMLLILERIRVFASLMKSENKLLSLGKYKHVDRMSILGIARILIQQSK